MRDSWQPHSCFLKHLLTEKPLYICKINSRIFVTTENKQQQLPLSTCSISYTGLSPWMGSSCSFHNWQCCIAVNMAQGVSHLCKGIPSVAHSYPAAPVLPTRTSASLSIIRKKCGYDKIAYHHTSEWEKELEPKEWHLRASPCLVTPSPSPWPCHHQAFHGQGAEGFPPYSEASSAVFKEIARMNPIKLILHLSYITTYLVPYMKTSAIGWILTETKKLCVSPPALKRCSESWFPLAVRFNLFN